MEDWSARQYLKFEDERTRPPRDLVAQVPLQRPQLVVDLGCGPGNSTELLARALSAIGIVGPRFLARHAAQGARAAAEMQIHRGRYRDLDSRSRGTDLIFGNAVMQWLPDHPAILRRLLEAHAAGRRAGHADAGQYARAGVGIPERSRREADRGRIIRKSKPRRATICRRPRPITICSSRSARISISGTASTIT